MPWPQRIFMGKYPAQNSEVARPVNDAHQVPTRTGLGGLLRPRDDVERVSIPKAYEVELQTVIRALGEMKQPSTRWLRSGTSGVGVLVSDTMMFQRALPQPSDPNLGSFYGLALPLLKRGVPVEPVQIENATTPAALSPYRILLLTYEGQKPPHPAFHEILARWVKDGGALIVIDDDSDPYLTVREWWNTSPLAFRTPRQHLFARLGIPEDFIGLQHVGNGIVIREHASPARLSYKPNGATFVREAVKRAARATGIEWRETNSFVLRRGPYIVAGGLDESVPQGQPFLLHGRFIDLFDANLRVLTAVPVSPGKRLLLFDLDAPSDPAVRVVAAACRVRNERVDGSKLTFETEGIGETEAVVRCAIPSAPRQVLIAGRASDQFAYDPASHTIVLRFPNSISPTAVEVQF